MKKSFRGYLRDLKDLAVEYEKRIFRADKLEDKLNRACSLLTDSSPKITPFNSNILDSWLSATNSFSFITVSSLLFIIFFF